MASTTETGLSEKSGGSKPTNSGKLDEDGRRTERSLKGRDEFFKETYRFFDVLAHHRIAVVIGATVLIGACVAGGIFANRHEVQSDEARGALFLAEKASDTELKVLAGVKTPAVPIAEEKDPAKKEAADKAKRAEDEASSKKMEELAYSKLNVDVKFPDTVRKFRDVIAKYSGTRAAHEARMSLGTLYFNHGEAGKAAPLFQDASASASGSFEKSLAFQSWGYALENGGKPADAISAYEKALGYSEGSIKGDVLLSIARSQEALHDVAKARSTYDQIISQLPNTDAAKSAESHKAKLQ
jgi:TolA-binding protein